MKTSAGAPPFDRRAVALPPRRSARSAATAALVLAGAAVAGWIGPAQAGAAIPDYRVVTIPAPEPQLNATFGERLRAIGDVDGDGVRDVLMSASNHDGDNGSGGLLNNSGRVYIFSGRTQALLRVLEPPFPQADAKFGFWDASLGDVNGDGTGDIAISAAGQIVTGTTRTGQVYVYSGRTGQRLLTLNPPESLTPTGNFGGDFGGNVLGPGDLNGDGAGDVVVTASGAFSGAGAAYAYNGRTGALLYKVPNPDAAQASAFGFGSAEIGDVNGDGAAEFQIGAPRFNEGTVLGVGRAYVINGATGAVMHTLIDPEPRANNRFGQADADGVSLGDVTGDGKPDVYVDVFLADDRAEPENPLLPDTGLVHIFNGVSGAFVRTLRDPTPIGAQQFGASNASAGDLDQDGRPDSLISARGSSTTNRGKVYVFGGPGLSTVLKTFEDPGDSQLGALFGTGLASPGDVNGDGRPDYFMSSRGADIAGVANVGIAYAFISVPPPLPPAVTPPPPPPPPAIVPPPPPPAVPPAVRRAGRLSAAVSPTVRRTAPFRFRISGRLMLPAGVPAAAGCSGRVSVQTKRGGTTISARRVNLSSACRYSVVVTFSNRRRFGRATRLKFTARFGGNTVVSPATAQARFSRIR